MTEITCITCGVKFGMDTTYREKLRECHNTFYCPNGHSMYYPDPTTGLSLRARERKDESGNNCYHTYVCGMLV